MGAFRIHHNSEELMVSQHLGRVWGAVLSQPASQRFSHLSPALPPSPGATRDPESLAPRSPPSHPRDGSRGQGVGWRLTRNPRGGSW